MPLDPQARTILDQLAALGAPPMETLAPEVARANAEAAPRPTGPEVHRVEERTFPGPDGDLPVRVYTPEGSGPFPALVWFHGGGWVIGSPNISDASMRIITNEVGCVVVSVDYRLAPESKFPAAADDCYAATRWVANSSSALNVDGRRIAVGGDSAGGNLAAAVALMARDKGGPALAHQVLVYPVIDREFTTPSYQDNGEGYLLSKPMMAWFWDLYLRDDADASNPYAAPIKATDLKGVAPALIITAEFDPLRDEGEAYGQRLSEAGVPTVCSRYDGMIHGFFGMIEAIDRSREAIKEASTTLKRAFAG
ncbi:MAG: alpha/beta hydrolase [Dehalococcoidia bacterium]